MARLETATGCGNEAEKVTIVQGVQGCSLNRILPTVSPSRGKVLDPDCTPCIPALDYPAVAMRADAPASASAVCPVIKGVSILIRDQGASVKNYKRDAVLHAPDWAVASLLPGENR